MNNRDEYVSREVYSGGMVEHGYSSNARSSTVIVEVVVVVVVVVGSR